MSRSSPQTSPTFYRMLLASLIVHTSLGVTLALGMSQTRPHKVRNVVTTKLVKLGKKRPKHLMPRLNPSPPPPQKSPAPKAKPPPKPPSKPPKIPKKTKTKTKTPNKGKAPKTHPTTKPSAAHRAKEMGALSNALQRIKSKATPDGDPEGHRQGSISDKELATIGHHYLTQVQHCIRQHYTIEGIHPSTIANRQATLWLKIDPLGNITQHKIEISSEVAAFDRSVKKAVQQCKKVPPPPPEIRGIVTREGIEVVFSPH